MLNVAPRVTVSARSTPRHQIVMTGGTRSTTATSTIGADMRDTAAMIGFMALIAALVGSFVGVAYGVAVLISQTITAALAGVI